MALQATAHLDAAERLRAVEEGAVLQRLGALPERAKHPRLLLVPKMVRGGYPVDGREPGGRVARGLGFLVHGSEARQLR